MRSCGKCGKSVKKIGPPQYFPSGFIDQLLDCPYCGWCGVETKIIDDEQPQPEPQPAYIQLSLFDEVNHAQENQGTKTD